MIDDTDDTSMLQTPHVSLTADDERTSTLILPKRAPVLPGKLLSNLIKKIINENFEYLS